MEHFWHFIAARVADGTALAVLLLWATVVGSVVVVYGATVWRLIPWSAIRAGDFRTVWHTFRASRLGTILRHPSSRADFLFFITRRLTFIFFTVPSIFTAAYIGSLIHRWLEPWVPSQPGPATPLLVYAFTFTMFLTYDVAYYWYHYLQHHVGWMWHLHKVHHSAEVLVGVTKDRVHPIDLIMNEGWNALIVGPVFAFWSFFIASPIEATILGVNVYTLRNILMMDLIRHTHLPISFGWLNKLVISPHYHQLHHSTNPKHYNKNFGLMLAVWDRLFGTFATPRPDERFQYGLSDGEHHEYQSVLRLYIVPLMKIFGMRVPENRHVKGEEPNALHL